jgi:hypothetical protein
MASSDGLIENKPFVNSSHATCYARAHRGNGEMAVWLPRK